MHEIRFRLCVSIAVIIALCTFSIWQVLIGMETGLTEYQPAIPVYKINPVNYTYVYPVHTLPVGDYNKLIDMEDFYFPIMDITCNDSSPLLLVLVHSAPGNFEKRKIIRGTWGQTREGMKLIFMLGNVDNDTLEEKLQRENEIYRDFAQGNFLDTYRNMTYKHVMVLKYVVYYCPTAKYILKTDDDVYVNIVTMMNFLKEDLSPNGVSDLLLCRLCKDAEVFRSYRSKWRVSAKEYPRRTYPPYCPGFALIYSPDVVFALYKEAQRSNYFWIDDVHVTGTLAKKANLTHTDVTQLILSKSSVEYILDGNEYRFPFLYGPADLPGDKIRGLWNAYNRHANKRFKYVIQ